MTSSKIYLKFEFFKLFSWNVGVISPKYYVVYSFYVSILFCMDDVVVFVTKNLIVFKTINTQISSSITI